MLNKTKIATACILIVVLMGGLPLSNVSAATTAAALSPTAQTINVGQTTVVTFAIQDVQDLYGYQAAVGFNPSVLEVVDADAAKAGIQVALGSFLQPDFVQQNNADNSLGAIVCVVSQMSPHTAVSGSGALFTITFRGKGQGASNVYFTDLKLARADGIEIVTTQQNAQVNVGSVTDPTSTPTPTATATTIAPTSTPTTVGPTPTATATTIAPTSTPTPLPSTPAPGQSIIYVVRAGDTLYSIARYFGVTVEQLAYLNKIVNPSRIYAGQRLIIPRSGVPQPTPTVVVPTCTPVPGATPFIHIVQHGDTLYSIARRYGTTIQALMANNNITNPSRIYAGQRLVIYGSGGTQPYPTPVPSRVHIVQPGETLFSIARHYGTTAWAIAMANRIYNPNIIYAGQRLIIP